MAIIREPESSPFYFPDAAVAKSDVKPKISPQSLHRRGIASVFAHLVVTSIYTLAAATRSKARASLA